MPPIFDSVVYFINDDLLASDRAELKQILDAGGASPAESNHANGTTQPSGPGSGALPPGARFDPAKTTHVISASIDFPEYDACDDPQADHLQQPSGKRACVVSSQWVRRSWSLGSLQPELYFSADPGLYFSGIVVSCARLPKQDTELIAAAVMSCGGNYRDKLTREVTHLIASNRQGPKFAKLNAIYDAQAQQLADAAATLSSAITDEAQQNGDAEPGKAMVAHDALNQLSQLAKSQWNVKAVLPAWIDDCWRLFKLVDPKPYSWPLGEKAQTDGTEPVYITDRSVQAPFGTSALKNASYTAIPGATVGSGALHNHAAAQKAFNVVAQAVSSSKYSTSDVDQSSAAQTGAVAGHSSAPINTPADALVQLTLHAPENRGWPTFEELAPAIKDSERLVVPVDERGNEVQPGASGPSGRRSRGLAGSNSSSTSAGKAGAGGVGNGSGGHGNLLAGRAVLFGADVMMANPDRVFAFRTRIQAAGGVFVEPPEQEGEVPAKVTEADIVVTKYRESRECLQALKQAKVCGSPQWLAFVLSTGRITNPRNNLLHFPIPKEPIPAFTKFTITLTNYTGEARTLLRHLITCMGGKFTPEMTSANTHCIAASEEGEKVKRAKEWGIPVLNHIWLETCFTRWQAVDVLQTRFAEYGPAIRYGKQVLVDARLEDGVLEPWIQRAFEDEDAEQARLSMEAEILAKRQAAEDDARAIALGTKTVAEVQAAKEAAELKVAGSKSSRKSAANEKASSVSEAKSRTSSRNGAAAGQNAARDRRAKHLADASILMDEQQEDEDDEPAVETRSTRDRKPTKKAAADSSARASTPTTATAAVDEPSGSATRSSSRAAAAAIARNSNGAARAASDDDEMDVDAVVGGGSGDTSRNGTARSGLILPTRAALNDSPASQGTNKVKRRSGAGPASRVPERKSLAENGSAPGTRSSGGAAPASKRGREVDEDSEDSVDEDLPGSGRPRSSRRTKASPDQKIKTITPPRKASRISSTTSLRDAASKRDSDSVYYATTGVNVSDADVKLLRTLGANRTEDMFKATHLVAAGLSRTEKMLCAIARGDVMIVDQAWLQMSVRKKALQEEANFPIQDPKSERKYGIKLEEALERSRAKPAKLLRKHEFYMTRNVKPAAEVLRKVILAAGGSAPNALPNIEKLEEDRTHMHLISCEEDRALWKDFAKDKNPVRVYEAELIIAGVLKQHMDWESHRLL